MTRIARPIRRHADIDREYPDPPFSNRDYQSMKVELETLQKAMPSAGKGPSLRDLWIVKNKGGRIVTGYGLTIWPTMYQILSKKWENYCDWQTRIEYAEGRRLSQLDDIARESIGKMSS